MHSPSLKTAVGRIRSLTAPLPDGLSDRDLVRRFLATRDESAFAALVARHGPAVLGVCRRILLDRHAAEDAVQATFLVLARRAAAMRKTASVGCWLHGVAVRVSLKLKARLARQPRPASLPDIPADPADDVSWRDVRRVLDEEVHRLPDRLRLPIWLCYFEGKTRDEAAETLGWKLTTLRGRLEDGRQRLQARLALRGVELSAALLAVSTAEALALDGTLIQSTIQAATGTASRVADSLARGVALSGTAGKLILPAGGVVLALGLGSALLVYRGEAGERPGNNPEPKVPEVPAKTTESPPKPPAKNDDWGEPAGDFKLRLRKPAGPLRVGDLPELVCDLKFTGKEETNVLLVPEYASIGLNGRWYRSHREGSFASKTTELAPNSEHPAWLGVRPDDKWIHLRDKPDDPAVREAVSFHLSGGKHTLRVAYPLSKAERVVSNLITIEVASDGWGEPSAGVKSRLRLAKMKYKPGEPLAFELDLKNERGKPLTVDAFEFGCAVLLDGERYTYQGPIDSKANPKELKPGGDLVPFVTGTADEAWKARRPRTPDSPERGVDLVPFRLTPGRHRVEIAYPIEDPKARPVSNAVEIEVVSDGWGSPNGGVKSRIRLAKTKYRPGEPLEIELDLMNVGRKNWNVAATPSDCQLYLGDRMFMIRDELEQKAPLVELKAGSELVPFLKLRVDTDWLSRGVTPGHPFRLTPGQHRVRVDYPRDSNGRLSSNTVEIEVLAPSLDSTVQALALAADRIWVVPSPTRDKPVPSAAQVLKGPPADQPSVADLGLLPSDDVRKKWIAFLQADEVRRGVPEVKRIPATPWYVPYDEAVAAAMSEVWSSVDWGPEKDGLRMGVRIRDARVLAGNPVVAEVVIRNAGNSDRTIQQHRLNIYDYWPGTRFEVTAPNRAKWVLDKATGPIDELDALKDVTLKPGETYVHAVRLDRWSAHRDPPDGDASLPNLFTKPGRYMIACRYAKTPVVGEAGWQAGMVSIAVPLMVTMAEPKPGEWGESTDGLRARVRMPKEPVAAGGPLGFEFDLKNVGDTTREVPAYSVLCDLDLDGVRYSYPDKFDIKGNARTLDPGEEMAPFVAVGAETWQMAQPKRGEPAGIAHALTPGKHKLVVSFRLNDATRITAPPVEFEVKPDEWGEASGGLKARLRLAKATFRAGEPLAFELDLRNSGDKTYEDGPVPFHCLIDLDGAQYRYTAPLGYPTSIQKITPGKEFIPYVKVTTDQWWIHSRTEPNGEMEAVPLKLTPGKHKVRVSYPLISKDRVVPVSQTVEFEVVADISATPDLRTLVASADRIVLAGIDWNDDKPRIKSVSALLGPNNRWQPDVQPIDIPAWAEPAPRGKPDEQWVLFLKAEEDQTEIPKLSPAAAKGWFRRVTTDDLKKVMAAVTDRNVGPATDGLVLLLRPPIGEVHAGQEIRVDVSLSNHTTAPVRVLQQRYNVYDYWPFLTFTVTLPDGTTRHLAKPEGPFKREDFIDEFSLERGQIYTHVVRLDRWRATSGDRIPRELVLESPFRKPGTYKVQATYAAAIGFPNLNPKLGPFKEWPFWAGELKSNIVSIEVKPELAGKEEQGVRARLRPVRTKWKAGESPRFELDLINSGKRTWAGAPGDGGCLVEVDGAWYENDTGKEGPKVGSELVLKPEAGWAKAFDVFADRPRGGANAWILLTPDEKLRPIPQSSKLKLTPGLHTIRVAYFLTEYGENGKPLKGDAPEIRIESNQTTIEIER